MKELTSENIEGLLTNLLQTHLVKYESIFVFKSSALILLKEPINNDAATSVTSAMSNLNIVVKFYCGNNDLNELRLLRVIKTNQPITYDDILVRLNEKNIQLSENKELNDLLDRLRKSGFIVRMANQAYVLTKKGLSIVPYGRYRASSDIERALALGKRRA